MKLSKLIAVLLLGTCQSYCAPLEWYTGVYDRAIEQIRAIYATNGASSDDLDKALEHVVRRKAALLSAYEAGKADAQRDRGTGKCRLLVHGYPVDWIGDYRRLMHGRLGVEVDFIGGCCVEPSEAVHAKGYNEVASKYLAQKFGSNAVDKIAITARIEYEMRQVEPISYEPLKRAMQGVVFLILFLLLSIAHRKDKIGGVKRGSTGMALS